MHDPDPWFQYQARPDPRSQHERGVVDGDTLDLELDQGLRDYTARRCRLATVDTAEVYGVRHDSEEYARGSEQSEHTLAWVDAALDAHDSSWPLVVSSYRDETGRYCRLRVDVQAKAPIDGYEDDLAASLIDRFPDVADV